jgi:hypothetical protein
MGWEHDEPLQATRFDLSNLEHAAHLSNRVGRL